jgi:hypothetical protein
MRDLRELVSVVNQHKIKSLELLGPSLPASSKIMRLYEGISSGVFDTDEEAIIMLYGDQESGKNSYWKLKHDLKRRLLNTLFFIDQKQSRQSAYEKAFYSCHRDFTAARFLLRRGARHIAVELLRKALRKSQQIELTPVTLEALQLLRHHYGVILGDRRKFAEYNQRVYHYLQLYQAEQEADAYMEELLSYYVTDKSTKRQYLDKAGQYEKALGQALARVNSKKLQHRARFISVARNMMDNDYQATVQACLGAVRYFKRFSYIPDAYIRPYLYQLVVSYIQLQEYKKGEQAIRQLLGMLEPGQSNWFRAMELHCILALHSRDYRKARELCEKAVKHPKFKHLYPSGKEPWHIMEAFMHYLQLAGKTTAPGSHRFRLSKFINEVPVFARDKRGYNIPILIIQLLFFLKQDDTDAVNERLEAISRYAMRYFRGGEHIRTNCFIKMLNQLPRAFFRRRELERRTEAYVRQLQNVPLTLAREAHEIEIIPYEALWELVLEGLNR